MIADMYLNGVVAGGILAIAIGVFWYTGSALDSLPPSSFRLPFSAPTEAVCQADARVCPDGTVLSREGPNCAFPTCPTLSTPLSEAGATSTAASSTALEHEATATSTVEDDLFE